MEELYIDILWLSLYIFKIILLLVFLDYHLDVCLSKNLSLISTSLVHLVFRKISIFLSLLSASTRLTT